MTSPNIFDLVSEQPPAPQAAGPIDFNTIDVSAMPNIFGTPNQGMWSPRIDQIRDFQQQVEGIDLASLQQPFQSNQGGAANQQIDKNEQEKEPQADEPDIFDLAKQQQAKEHAGFLASRIDQMHDFRERVEARSLAARDYISQLIFQDKKRFSENVDIFEAAQADYEKKREGELTSRFQLGMKKSVFGEIVNLYGNVQTPEDLEAELSHNPTFWESMMEGAGELLPDAPFMKIGSIWGSAIGSIGGGAIGSIIPGAGTALGVGIGGAAGGGFGMFAFPQFLKSALREYRLYAKKGNDITFGEYLQSAANNTIKSTLTSGINGMILASVTPLMGGLSKIPMMKNLFQTKFGYDLADIVVAGGLLSGKQAVLEGRIPSTEEFAKSIAAVAVYKGLFKGPAAVKSWVVAKNMRYMNEKHLTNLGFSSKEIKQIEKASPKQIDKIVSNVQHRLALTTDVKGPKGKQVIALKVQNVTLEDQKQALFKKLKPDDIAKNNPRATLIMKQIHDLELKQQAVGDKIVQLEQKPLELKKELIPAKSKDPATVTVSKGRVAVSRDPVEDRIFKKISIEKKYNRFKDINWTRHAQDWIDDVYPIKKMTADILGIKPAMIEEWVSPLNPYIAARTFKGTVRRAEHFLEFGTLRAGDLSLKGKPLLPTITALKDREIKELRMYLVAKRDLEKGGQGFVRTFSKRDAQQIVQKYHSKYESIKKDIVQYQDDVLEYLKDSGRISAKQMKEMQAANRDYVPFFRIFEAAEKGMHAGTGHGALKSLHKFKGSKATLNDPIESIIRNTYDMVRVADLNRVGQMMVKMSRVNPDTGEKYIKRIIPPIKTTRASRNEILKQLKAGARTSEIPIDDQLFARLNRLMPESIELFRRSSFAPQKNVISVWFDGKRQFYKVTPELYKSFQAGAEPYEMGIFAKILSYPASSLRAGAILNPRFMQRNIVRDWLGGAVLTRADLDPIYGPFAGLSHSWKQDDVYRKWLASGGGMSTMQEIDKGMNMLAKYKTPKTVKGIGRKVIRGPIEFLRAGAELTEEMNRLNEFMSVLKVVDGKTRAGKEFAAFAGRDLSIDFAKIGLKARALNHITVFWNAAVQGSEKILRTMKKPGMRWEASARAFMGIALPSLMMSMANEGDKDIEELTPAERDLNFVFKLDDKIVTIPVPFQIGMVYHGLSRRFYDQIVSKKPEAWKGFMKDVTQEILPPLVPQATKPFIENWANKDFWSGRAIIPHNKEGMLPRAQYKNYTTETAKFIGRAFEYLPNYLTLGEEGIAATVIEHFTNSWFGGLGKMALNLSDEGLRAAGNKELAARPEQTIAERLGLNVFVRRYPTAYTSSIEKFYELTEKAQRLRNTIKQFVKEGKVEEAKELTKIDTYPKVDRVLQSMRNMQATINNIFNNPKMKPHEKRELIDAMYLQMIEFARHANTQMEAFIKQQEAKQKLQQKQNKQ